MINATGLRWVLTALFALPALYSLRLAVRPGRRFTDRVAHLLHAVMGVSMVAMAWPWGAGLPADPQIVVFSAGAPWFAVVALVRSTDTRSPRARLMAASPHVVMMAAMVWMAAVMDGPATAPGAHNGAQDMPGMDMSGTDAASAMTLTRSGEQWAAGLLALALLVIGVRWLSQAFDRARGTTPAVRDTPAAPHGEVSEPACHAAMAVGMAVMCVLLL